MTPVLIAVVLAILTTLGPFILTEIAMIIGDAIQKSRIAKAPRAQQVKMMEELGAKRRDFNGMITSAMRDQRLVGKTKPIMVPDEKKIDEMKRAGQQVDENNPPMKQLQNTLGEPISEYVYEKYDKRFDEIKDGASDPIVTRIYVDPGKGAPTYTGRYRILFLIALVVGTGACVAKLYAGLALSFILGIVLLVMMKKHGKECQDALADTWSKINDIYTKHMGTLKDGETIQDRVEILDWDALGEAQSLANARTMAAEKGLSQELNDILPKPDKKGRLVKPRRAVFRNIPCKMVFHFDTGFMESQKQTLLDHLNQNIGGGKVEWVAMRAVQQPDGSMLQMDGWDFDKMEVYLMTLPPLPMKASLPEDIDETPWNVIRLGRTVDGEAVWDISGQGWGQLPRKNADGSTVRDEFGYPVFPKKGDPDFPNKDTIHHAPGMAGVTCPMSLVPLDTNTEMWTLVEVDEKGNEMSGNGGGAPERALDWSDTELPDSNVSLA